ncbi:aminotransferase class V-fold PLP-dependent enzyme [Natroniella sulfidigena]|uniref:aminotransferase class V-fold PLP-dependent enzyme n=1 Tax=Natroniella sulfidigena TaxID=723921 RepID=UPI00200B81F7|nr:aminotransferase class V-fold PLP-dependent enzyme [Natroniella sulfidigena]MCK8816731.1 aminotransferase class V-fold PLP-dependent enzyme [Natroniella sulfidigena]
MIYLNNAATTWPKPEQVYQEVDNFFRDFGMNPGRTGRAGMTEVERKVFAVREKIADFFKVQDSSRVIFTSGATESLNLAIKGLLKSGDHVITTCFEHNSVLRPLKKLEKNLEIELSVIGLNQVGGLDLEQLKKEIKENTKLIVTTHASNVTGRLVEIEQVAQLAEENDLFYLLDAAQTAGVFPLDLAEAKIDLVALPGHKYLYGPPGIGVLYLAEGVELDTLLEGGTGTNSLATLQPELLPDRFESGTANITGIAGLGAGLDFVKEVGVDRIRKKELELTSYLLEELKEIPEVIIYGPLTSKNRAPVVAFNLKGKDSAKVGHVLQEEYGIIVRSGLHCAPVIHQRLKTDKQGMIRVSFGYFNTQQDVEQLVVALKKIIEG